MKAFRAAPGQVAPPARAASSDAAPEHAIAVVEDKLPTADAFGSGPQFSSSSSLRDEKLLPPGKQWHYFLSHKKQHSVFGGVPEQIARNFHDSLELLGYKGWFDVDNLKRIQQEDLRTAISQCCSLIIVLHDETLDSEWCTYEWQCAKELGVPCKVVVDMERASKAVLLPIASERFAHLLEFQWLEFTARHRRDCLTELCDFLETFAYGAAGNANAAQDSEVLVFGRSEIRVVPDVLERLLDWSGIPLTPPKNARGKAYVFLLFSVRLVCLAICIWRFVYAHGPAYSDRHSALMFVLFHVYFLIAPWLMKRMLLSDTFKHMLRSVEGASGEECARRLSFELRQKSTAAAAGWVPGAVPIFLAFLPLFFDDGYIGANASSEERIFGWVSGVWFSIGLMLINLSLLAFDPLLHLIYTIDLYQFEAAFDVLDPSLAQLGLHNHVQQVANALRRRTKSAAGTQGQLSSGGQLRVTPKSLALFHEACPICIFCENEFYKPGAGYLSISVF